MPIPEYYLTTPSGPGSTTAQTTPGASLGGYASTTPWTGGALHDLFHRASSSDVSSSRGDYRGLFVYNPDTAVTMTGVTVEVTAVTDGAAGVRVGVDPRPATYPDSLSPQLVEISTAYAAPAGVTFSTLVDLGDLPPGTGKGLWILRTPTGVDGSAEDEAALEISGGGVDGFVSQILWEVEPYAQYTRPVVTPTYTPTPTPFRRVGVDFLSQRGSRFTWQLDRSFSDAGPYVFQLQASRVGTVDAPDWEDVGSPSQDPTYLLDPEARLWGQAKPWFYRAILTTAQSSYTSPAANVYGLMNAEQWLLAREVLRKEDLHLRRLAGLRGTLLKARRYGPRCACVDPVTGEVGNSSDTVCYGTGYVDGYYPPIPLTFALPTPRSQKERVAYNEGLGTVLPDVLRARVLAGVPIMTRDAWVQEGGDDRYYVHKLDVVASWQGVPLVYEATMLLAPRSDVLYTLQIERADPELPTWKQPTTLDL